MQELDTKRSRTGVLYASMIVVVLGAIGFAAAYSLQDGLNEPQRVVGDPSKRIGKGDGKSENPMVLGKVDKQTGAKNGAQGQN